MSTHVTATPIFHLRAPVTALRALAPGYMLMTVHAPEIARHATPGQFAQLRATEGDALDPLLARPISIYRVTETGEVSFIFKVIGRGTALLAQREPGSLVTVLGPVGNGFVVPASARHLALVAGGVGMPPMYFLAERLRKDAVAREITLFYGGRSATDLLELPAWEALGVTVRAATEDGSQGTRGFVTEPLNLALAAGACEYLAACGPKPMLRAVQALARDRGVPGQLSLEERMACGVGACLGCVCATVQGRKRVCVDGPVFALDEVTFDA